MAAGPPLQLVRSLVDGPSRVSALEWHDAIDSTNRRAAEAAQEGASEIHVVLADIQTAGRGRLERTWVAPPGTSLLMSLLVRPPVAPAHLSLLPLLAGLCLAEAVGPHVAGRHVGLKWPNDLLVDGRKAAGILVETVPAGAVVGLGLNVDWRGVDRPEGLVGLATSLAEAHGAGVDRWRVLAAFLGVFGNRYGVWCERPLAFLDEYRSRCATLGAAVRVDGAGGRAIHGTATGVAASGALEVCTSEGETYAVSAGDVTHVRPTG